MDFVSKVLPAKGHKVLAVFHSGKDYPKHYFYESDHEFKEAVSQFDEDDGNVVYYACASYKEPGSRKGDNVAWIKDIWVDVDVGKASDKNSYKTKEEARDAVVKMLKDLDLPAPMIVSSGMGFHLHWPLEEEISKDEWLKISTAFARAMAAVEFKQDPSRTKDPASILRPVGATWRKNGENRPVKLVRDADEFPVSTFNHIVEKYSEPVKVSSAFNDLFGVSDDLGNIEYPPSSAENIIKFCGAIRTIAQAKGMSVAEPAWRAMLGVVKHTTEGESLCHEWSKGDPRYTEEETQKKIDGWVTGPATCAQFEEHCSECSGCKYKETIKSPIQLGYAPVTEADAEIPEPVEVHEVNETNETEPAAESPEVDDNSILYNGKIYKLPAAYNMINGCMMGYVQGPEGESVPVRMTRVLFMPISRIKEEDGYRLVILAKKGPGRIEQFTIPTKAIYDKRSLLSELANHEIYAESEAGGKLILDQVKNYAVNLRAGGVETFIHKAFGWNENLTKFVIGDTEISTKGEEKVIQKGTIGGNSASRSAQVAGTIESWADAVDSLYNIPGAEAVQFVIGAAFAAPLVKVLTSTNFHGIPVCIAGESGKAKTTVCNVATSIYGPYDAFVTASGESDTTAGARTYNLAVANHLPVVFDEFVSSDPKEVRDLLYSASNGKNKQRLMPNGDLTESSKLRWDTISLMTSNQKMSSILQLLTNIKQSEATQVRIFAVDLDSDPGWDLTFDSAAEVQDLLNQNYGAVGRDWIRYIMKNTAQIKSEGDKFVNAYIDAYNQMKSRATRTDIAKERFIIRLIAYVLFALRLAKSLGYVGFDLKEIKTWADAQVIRMRSSRNQGTTSTQDLFASFLASLEGHTVTTKNYHNKPESRESSITPLRGEPYARRVLGNGVDKSPPRLIVTAKSFTDWCRDNDCDKTWLLGELTRYGYVDNSSAGKVVKFMAGTTYAISGARVIEFNMDKIIEDDIKPKAFEDSGDDGEES